MAIKTFEQFTHKGIYTENEYNTVYKILSDFIKMTTLKILFCMVMLKRKRNS